MRREALRSNGAAAVPGLRYTDPGMRRLVCIAILLLGTGSALAAPADPDRIRTESLVAAYERTESWPVRALALLSLGERWHPAGAKIVLDALQSSDPRLRVYGIEALRSTPPEHLRCVLVPELLGQLIKMQMREKNARVRMHLVLLLARTFPRSGAVSRENWRRWWRDTKGTYAARPWIEKPPQDAPEETKTVAAPSIMDRAFDLSQGGIQLVLVVDSTGSMQPTIDAVRAGLRDVFSFLSGLTTDMEVGLVHYRDHMDFPGQKGEGAGAEVLARLSRGITRAQKHLDAIQAQGGGDMPERVTGGLWRALQSDMGWKPLANKMVIVLGDAPPHTVERSVELAREAHESPDSFLKSRRRVVTGPGQRSRSRPFVTSTVAVGNFGPHSVTTRAFRRISTAGGGAYVDFSTRGDARDVTTEIVKRLVELSFGDRYVAEARRLVDIYFTYQDAGYIRE